MTLTSRPKAIPVSGHKQSKARGSARRLAIEATMLLRLLQRGTPAIKRWNENKLLAVRPGRPALVRAVARTTEPATLGRSARLPPWHRSPPLE